MTIDALIKNLPNDSIWLTLKIIGILLINFALIVIIRKHTNKIIDKAHQNNHRFSHLITSSIQGPLYALTCLVSFYYIVAIVFNNLKNQWTEKIDISSTILINFILGWFLIKFVDGASEYFLNNEEKFSKKNSDRTFVTIATKITKLTIVIIIGIMILDNLGVKVGGFLTIAGIGTAAIGFASKDLIANYFGTMVIFFDRPFDVGDWISSSEKDIEGIIEDINWRMTKIKTLEHRILYVPNSYFLALSIQNHSRGTARFIELSFGIDEKDLNKTKVITEELKNQIFSHPGIEMKHKIIVTLDSLSGAHPNILVQCYAKTKDHHELKVVKEDILLLIIDILKKNNAQLSFKT